MNAEERLKEIASILLSMPKIELAKESLSRIFELTTQSGPVAPELAVDIPIDKAGLRVNVGRDGTWIHFTAIGLHASLCVDALATSRGPIVGGALVEWCNERCRQAKEIRAARKGE